MWYSSFGRAVFTIGLIILGLSLVVVGLWAYGKYWYSPPASITTLNSSNASGQIDTQVDDSARLYLPTADDDPALGAADATIEIIAFEDYQCPFCKSAVPIMKQVLQKYPNDVRYVYRDFPLYTIHAEAQLAAEASECADEQDQFWAWHDLMFERQDQLGAAETVFPLWAEELGLDTDQFTTCLETEQYKDEVEKDINSGVLSGVTATPTYFVNGNKLVGALSLEQWDQVIAQLLAE